MDRQKFIQNELARLLRDWFIKASLVGAGVFLLLAPLDYVTVPELFRRFLTYRIAMALVLAGLALAASRIRTNMSVKLLAFLAVFFSAATIEIMIIQFHGHHSPYYPGMILLAVVSLGFFPAGIRFHTLLMGTIYLVYLVPLLVAGDIHDPRTFFTQNYFLLLILGAGLTIRHFNLIHLTEKIGLNYDVLKQQENLEALVEERTAKISRAIDEWRATFDSTEDMIMLVDGDGAIVRANKALAAFAGVDVRELVGASCLDICSRKVIPDDAHPFKRMQITGTRQQEEFYSSGRDRWFLVSAEPLETGHLRGEGGVLIMRDISGIKILEQGLVESKEEWEETFNVIEEGISIHDEHFTVLQANTALARLLATGDRPLVGQKCHELFHGTGGPIQGCPGGEAGKMGKAVTVDFFEPTLNRYLEVTALPRPARNGRGGGIIHVVRDITERKEAIDEINKAYHRMKRILEMAPFGVFIVNGKGVVEYANSAMRSIAGFASMRLAGSHIGEMQGCRDIGLDRRILSSLEGTPFRFGPVEFQCHGKDEKSVGHFTGIPVEEGGARKVIVFVDNVTDLKRAEEERSRLQGMLLESQKMESIGTLAGGIAHDFNNILTAIMNYAGLVLMKLPEESPVRQYVSTILESGEKAAGLTRQLLDFSRRQPLQCRPVALSNVIKHHVKMLHRIIGEDISLELNLQDSGKNILADQGKIEQVLLNLAVNASDAMPIGGTLTIETSSVDFEKEIAVGAVRLDPGQYIRLTVRDTGAGMSAETQKRIFEPFFTTKEAGEGTGLGLATVYGIIKQHKGAIEVRSSEGQGTAFTLYFPVTLEEEVRDDPASPAAPPRGSETVLVVDDNPKTLASIVEVLDSLGYTVLSASSGKEALDMVGGRDGSIDLMLADVIMEGMNGKELSEAAAAMQPGLRMLFMSGYGPEQLAKRGVCDLPGPVVRKPVHGEALGRQVREALIE